MIPQHEIERVLELDIYTIISKYVPLKKRGVNYIGCCPFHGEKTGSFTVSSAKGIYKCFGCGVGGNSVNFVMAIDKLSFPEAIKKIASENGISITETIQTDEEKKAATNESERKESIRVAMNMAWHYFKDKLSSSAEAEQYMLSRIPFKDFWELIGVGFAPDGNQFKTYALENSLSSNICIDADLLAISNKESVFDKFQNRFIIPLHDARGNIIGFNGRDLTGTRDDKYNNTKTIPGIHEKSKYLYGLNYAYKSIQKLGFSFLVEGNIDCLTLHAVNHLNAVAVGGSQLTDEQVAVLKKYTDTVCIIPDNDKTGQEQLEKWATKLIESGFTVKVLVLPINDKIKDVNDMFCHHAMWEPTINNVEDENIIPLNFTLYHKKYEQDFIIYFASKSAKLENIQQQGIAVRKICGWLTHFDSAIADIYINELGTTWGPKDKYKKKYKELADKLKETDKGKPEKPKIPKDVDIDAFEKYGFYEVNNKYIFDTSKGNVEGSNFIMQPLFHIESVMDSRRMYRIINEWGVERIIELKQEDLINLSRFKKSVESLGNFIWKTDDSNLTRLKSWLYEKTDTCKAIDQLGYQPQGFWAWGNGIYDGEFKPVDNIGIVKMGVLGNFYLPAFSDIYKNEHKLFQTERSFIYKESDITWESISHKIVKVYGDQAVIGLCFYITTLFADVVVRKFNFFPILNLFGPKGAGKTALANVLLQFFGPMPEGPKLPTTSLPSVAEYVASFNNALVNCDEYKNSLEVSYIEFLKGLWGRIGRTVKNMDRDKKKETSSVNSGVILTGQEMPTADIALFSRILFVAFYKTEYSTLERREFMELEDLKEKGFSHITCQLLEYRKTFIDNFDRCYDEVCTEINTKLKGVVIEDRIYRNWAVIIAGYATIRNFIKMPIPYESFMNMVVDLMKQQNIETKRGSDVMNFWGIVEYLYREGLIENEIDFRVEQLSSLKINDTLIEFAEPTDILFIDHTKTFMLYRKHGKQTIEQVLPIPTLQYYLQNSKEFLGLKKSIAFKIRDVITKQILSDDKHETVVYGEPEKAKKYRVTTAYCFRYDKLGINIKHSNTENADVWENSVDDLMPLDREKIGKTQGTYSTEIGHLAKTNSSPIVVGADAPF